MSTANETGTTEQPRPKCKECGAPVLRDGEQHGIVAPPRLREPFYLEDDAEPAAPPAPSAPPDAWNSTEPLTMQPKYAAPRPTVEMPALVMPVHRAYCQKASYRGLPCTCERRKGERRVKDNGPLFRNSPAGENPYAEDSRFRHDRRAVAPTPPNLESQVSSGVSHADLRAAISPAAHNAATGSVLDTAGIQSRPLDKRKYVASSGVIAGISDRVSLHVCRGNSDLLHDDEQFAACYQCNPPSAAPSEGHRKTLDKVVRGGITEGVEEARRWLIERGFEPYGEAAMQKEIESHLAFAADRTRVLQDRNKTLLRRTELLQAGYQDASAQVTALTIQKMQLEADGADVVVIRQRDNLSRAMLKQLEARKAAESALAQANAEMASKDSGINELSEQVAELRTSLAAANAEISDLTAESKAAIDAGEEACRESAELKHALAAAQGTIAQALKAASKGDLDENQMYRALSATVDILQKADTSCFDAAIREATAKERERCAKIAQEYCGESSFDCAEKIRLAPSSLQEQTK